MNRAIREARHWKKVQKRSGVRLDPSVEKQYRRRRPHPEKRNAEGEKIRAEEHKIQVLLCKRDPVHSNGPGADNCYVGIVKKLYRTYVKEHGFCPVEEIPGDAWAVLFRDKLFSMLHDGNPYSKGQFVSTTYYVISHAVRAVEVCFHVTIDRKTVRLQKTLHCKNCGAVLVPVGPHDMIGCPACGTAARAYPGTNIPSAIPVGPMVRALRAILHHNFDPLWRLSNSHADNTIRRQAAYQVLASYADVPVDEAHFSRIRGLRDASRLMNAVNEMRKAQGLPIRDVFYPDGTCYHDGIMIHGKLKQDAKDDPVNETMMPLYCDEDEIDDDKEEMDAGIV